ncbi:hypothetical protein ACTFIU_002677 [Dictyostelium citrinum]
MKEYPNFAQIGKSFSSKINKDFDNIIGIYNSHYIVCLKENDNVITLYDINDGNKQYKQYTNICKQHDSCQKKAKIIDDTLFLECLFSNEKYHYSIIYLSNDKLYQSKDYSYGTVRPINNKEILECCKAQIQLSENSKELTDINKVSCFNVETQTNQVICIFSPIPNETLTNVLLSRDGSKLIVTSLFNNDVIVTVRSIKNRIADEISKYWVVDKIYKLHEIKIVGNYLIILSSKTIDIYDLENGKNCFCIASENGPDKNQILFDSGSFATIINNVVLIWNRHTINNRIHLKLSITEFINSKELKDVIMDPNGSTPNPPISITTDNNTSKLIVVVNSSEVYTIEYN